MQKKPFKLITVSLILSIFIFGCLCAMAARCGPYEVQFSDLFTSEFTDEQNGAYFRKVERGDYAFGYITLKNGERVSAYTDYSPYGICVREMFAGDEDSILFAGSSTLDMGSETVVFTVTEAAEGIELGFTELVLQITRLTEVAELNPYELTEAYWYDADNIFALSYNYQLPVLSRILTCYGIDGNGYIYYGQYDFKWTENGFEICKWGKCIASGTYVFDAIEFELTLTFESDDMFGVNKPFASYPNLILQTNWDSQRYFED